MANMEGAQINLCVTQVDTCYGASPTYRVADRKEEERIVSLKVLGGGRGCSTMCSGNDGGSRSMEEDDQQVVPLKNVIPLFLLLRARAHLGFRVLLLLL